MKIPYKFLLIPMKLFKIIVSKLILRLKNTFNMDVELFQISI